MSLLGTIHGSISVDRTYGAMSYSIEMDMSQSSHLVP